MSTCHSFNFDVLIFELDDSIAFTVKCMYVAFIAFIQGDLQKKINN